MHPRIEAAAAHGRTSAGRALGAAAQLEKRSFVVHFAAELGRRYLRTNVSLIVGSLAYRGFLFIVPVGVVVIALAGYADSSGGDASVEADERMGLGPAVGSVLSQAGTDAADGWQVVLTVGLTGVVFGAYSLYGTLFKAYAQVWEVPVRDVKKRLSTAARFVAGLLLFMIFLYAMGWVRRHGPILGTIGIVVSIAVDLVLFVLMSMALPNRARDWVHLVPGALAGGVATLGLQVVAVVWLPRQIDNRSQTYGALGVAVALLAYLALLGTVLVLVPLVNATWQQLIDERGDPDPLRPVADRAVSRARHRLGRDSEVRPPERSS